MDSNEPIETPPAPTPLSGLVPGCIVEVLTLYNPETLKYPRGVVSELVPGPFPGDERKVRVHSLQTTDDVSPAWSAWFWESKLRIVAKPFAPSTMPGIMG